MSWNNGYERKKFEQKQSMQANQFRALGMTEEQIHEIYLHDLEEHRDNRIFALHIQSIEEMEDEGEESRNVLHKNFLISMTCSMDVSECGRFGWIEEIENDALYCAVSKLTLAQKELLTLLYRDGYTQSELAERIYHTSAAAISKRLARIHNRIIHLVAKNGGLHQ